MSWVGINPVRRPVTFWPWNSTVLTDLDI